MYQFGKYFYTIIFDFLVIKRETPGFISCFQKYFSSVKDAGKIMVF